MAVRDTTHNIRHCGADTVNKFDPRTLSDIYRMSGEDVRFVYQNRGELLVTVYVVWTNEQARLG